MASFFKHLSVGGVARPVDTLLMAGLILYGSRPFDKAVKSKRKQLAYVFQVPTDYLSVSITSLSIIIEKTVGCLLGHAHVQESMHRPLLRHY